MNCRNNRVRETEEEEVIVDRYFQGQTERRTKLSRSVKLQWVYLENIVRTLQDETMQKSCKWSDQSNVL